MYPKMLFELIYFSLIYSVIYIIFKNTENPENSLYNKKPQCYSVCVNNTQLNNYSPKLDRIITNIEFMNNENNSNLPLRLECKFYKQK